MPKTPILQRPGAVPASPTPPSAAAPANPGPASSAKRYDEAFKRQAVEHWLRSGQPGTRIARDLGVSYPTLKEWKRRYHGDATPVRADLEAENRALQAELARVREQRDILKKNAGHPLRTVEARYERIESMSADHSIAQLCAALDVTRSGYHAWCQAAPSARAQADAALSQDIEAIHDEHCGRYGAPRIRHTLRQRGRRHSQKRVARLMRARGLRGAAPRRFVPQTTDSTHPYPIAPNRLAEASVPTAPNQTWVADLTYVRTAEGWLFLAVILDLFSRRVVGWAAGATLAAATVLAALQMALRQRQPPRGLLYHSDRGVQYACAEHRAVLATAGLEPSMSRAGNPYDNAAMESFMATYKRECVGPAEAAGGYATRADATADFFAYAEIYYNRERLHSALGYQTPVDFETKVN